MEEKVMAGELMLHCGGKPVSRLDLAEIVKPEETESYIPVGHLDLIEKVDGIARELLHRDLVRESFGIAKDGQRMFGVLTYKNGEDEDMGLSIGIRNSYDKSMSIGIALGGRVFVCDNLAISGDIRIVKRHIPGVWGEIEDMTIATLFKHRPVWDALKEDMARMKQVEITGMHGHELLGRLIGQEVLTPRQIPIAYREWDKPSLPDFQPRTTWSLYNAVNQALKTSPVNEILERHRKLHDTMMELQ
jgi:hypothetical protein